MEYFLAIDIGASSGRHIVGWKEKDELCTEETYRFPNFVDKTNGRLIWDIDRLFAEIKKGIRLSLEKFGKIKSMAIDTWGVDYVLLDRDNKEMKPVYAYRDGETEKYIDKVHSVLSFAKLYEKTGIQFQPFNTVYRLWLDKEEGRLQKAKDFLLMPEYFSYKLTGVIKKEYTNNSTTGLLCASQKCFDSDIIDKLGYPKHLFKELNQPSTEVGYFLPEIEKEVGGQIKVVFCPSHDTASAFYAVDVDRDTAILSSGTWSLFGAKLPSPVTGKEGMDANFSNEGGVGYIRFLKNIMGLWIIGELKKEFGIGFEEMIAEAKTSSYQEIFDVNDKMFLAPSKMSRAIIEFFTRQARPTPQGRADLFNTVYRSLAYSYKVAVEELETITKKHYHAICIIGGGAKNTYLNELTEEFCGRKVIALPIEATAIGNLKCQMEEK